MKGNITLGQYIEITEKYKSAALYDLEYGDVFEMSNPQTPTLSIMGVKLWCRDDEDTAFALGYCPYELFLRFNPDVTAYIKDRSEYFLQCSESSEEAMKEKWYWEVTKYAKIENTMCRIYSVYFSLECKPLEVSWYCDMAPSQAKLFSDYRGLRHHPETFIKMSDAQNFLYVNSSQLRFPSNVELPYQPGDILHINTIPFDRPFYEVYCAETNLSIDDFERTKRKYGYYKLGHPCLYISDDDGALLHTLLTDSIFPNIPNSPLHRITVVQNCEHQLLMKASALLKQNPDIYRKWLQSNRRNWGELISGSINEP